PSDGSWPRSFRFSNNASTRIGPRRSTVPVETVSGLTPGCGVWLVIFVVSQRENPSPGPAYPRQPLRLAVFCDIRHRHLRSLVMGHAAQLRFRIAVTLARPVKPRKMRSAF